MAKRGLGRGIDALLEGRDLEQLKRGGEVVTVAIDSLIPNDKQPRKAFSPETLQELADSIREKGVIQPLIVEDLGDGRYMIVAGERRYRAAKLAGLTVIPVIPRAVSEEDKLEIALIENLQRENLNPVEEAEAYQSIMELSHLNQEEMAKRLGKNRSTVANSLRLLKLPKKMQEELINGRLSAGHARALLSLADPEKRLDLFSRIMREGLSVRQAETLAVEYGGTREAHSVDKKDDRKKTAAETRKSPELKDIEEQLIHSLGTKVIIKGSEKRGKIEIDYFSMEDLERIFEVIAGREI